MCACLKIKVKSSQELAVVIGRGGQDREQRHPGAGRERGVAWPEVGAELLG